MRAATTVSAILCASCQHRSHGSKNEMYLHHLSFTNYGPLTSTSITPHFNENGAPKPICLVGVNGSGKSLLLSILLDAMVTARQQAYQSSMDVTPGKLFKPLRKQISSFNSSSFTEARAQFLCANESTYFCEAISNNPTNNGDFSTPKNYKSAPGFNQKMFSSLGFSKSLAPLNEKQKSSIKTSVLAFYPPGRAERPGWLSEHARVGFSTSPHFSDEAGYQCWRSDLVDSLSQYILNVVLDTEIYDNVTRPALDLQNFSEFNAKIPVAGRNRKILLHLNDLLSRIVSHGPNDHHSARFAISERQAGTRSVLIIGTTERGHERTIANNIADLSTGELSVLCIFADILRLAETNGWNRDRISEICGLVVIDEIDLHLHIRIIRMIIPTLIKMMPKIQFIFTTHSPFLPLGFNDGEVDIISLPAGIRVAASEFSEFQEAYDIFVEQNQQYKDRLEKIEQVLHASKLPLVVTEGKTDWRHLKFALERFHSRGEFLDLSVSFFETYEDMGSSTLNTCFKALEKMGSRNPTVFLFDRDENKYVSEYANCEGHAKVVGEKSVAAICLLVPDHRHDFPQICIEHLYRDDDLQTCLPGTEKRMRFRGEIDFRGDKKTPFLSQMPNACDKRIFDEDVNSISYADGSQKGELAISKNVFLEQIVLGELGACLDIEGFRPTFEKLRDVIARLSV